MSYLALSASFEYLCYGSMANINIYLIQWGDRLQILTSKVDPRSEKFNIITKHLFIHSFKTQLMIAE